jgi:hypothetical protein
LNRPTVKVAFPALIEGKVRLVLGWKIGTYNLYVVIRPDDGLDWQEEEDEDAEDS